MRSLAVRTRVRTRALSLLAVPALLLGATACGADELAENAAENAAERAIEEAASDGVEIDIDAEDGGVSIESSDGSVVSNTGSLPDGFPDDVPLLEGDIISGTAVDEGGSTGYAVSIAVAATVDEAMAAAFSELETAGFSPAEGGSMAMEGMLVELFTGPYEVSVTATDDGSGNAVVQYIVAQG